MPLLVVGCPPWAKTPRKVATIWPELRLKCFDDRHVLTLATGAPGATTSPVSSRTPTQSFADAARAPRGKRRSRAAAQGGASRALGRNVRHLRRVAEARNDDRPGNDPAARPTAARPFLRPAAARCRRRPGSGTAYHAVPPAIAIARSITKSEPPSGAAPSRAREDRATPPWPDARAAALSRRTRMSSMLIEAPSICSVEPSACARGPRRLRDERGERRVLGIENLERRVHVVPEMPRGTPHQLVREHGSRSTRPPPPSAPRHRRRRKLRSAFLTRQPPAETGAAPPGAAWSSRVAPPAPPTPAPRPRPLRQPRPGSAAATGSVRSAGRAAMTSERAFGGIWANTGRGGADDRVLALRGPEVSGRELALQRGSAQERDRRVDESLHGPRALGRDEVGRVRARRERDDAQLEPPARRDPGRAQHRLLQARPRRRRAPAGPAARGRESSPTCSSVSAVPISPTVLRSPA